MIDTTNVLWYGEISVQLLFCLYLIWTGLGKNYPTFTACLGCAVLRSLAAIYFMRGAVGALLPRSYTYFWLWCQPFWLLLLVAVALEVHAKLWKEHPAVFRQTRLLLVFALLTALVSAGIPLKSGLTHAGDSRLVAVMHFEIHATQYISGVLAIFLFLSAGLFVIVAGHGLKASLFRHEGMLAAYFGIYALAAFLIDMGWVRTSLVNGYFVSALTLCFVLWISVFKPQPLASP
jgi:hypothetical protein